MTLGIDKRLVRAILPVAAASALWGAVAPARATVPVEFPGPVLIETPGPTTSGCEVPGEGGAASRFLVGTADGQLLLAAYLPHLDVFSNIGSVFLEGRVTSITLLPDAGMGPREVVAAVADPDRLVFVDMASGPPYFTVHTVLDLEEDPGAVTGLTMADGTVDRVVVALPGIDRIETAERDGAEWRLAAGLDSGDRPVDLEAADLDGDGASELVVALAGALSRSLHVYRAEASDLVFDHELPLPHAPVAMTTLDRNRDDVPEFVVTVAEVAVAYDLEVIGARLAVAGTIDLRIAADGVDTAGLIDGRLGLYLTSRERGLVEVLTTTGTTWRPGDVYYPSCRPRIPLAGEFNGDGRVDVVSLGGDIEAASIMYGDAQGGLHGFPVLSLSGRPGAAIMGDLDLDTHDDVVVGMADAATLNTFRGDGSSVGAEPHSQPLGFTPGSLALIQFDADPQPELAVVSISEGAVRIMDRSPGGDFVDHTTVPFGVAGNQVLTADMDADGHDDLLVLVSSRPEVRVCYGTGDGAFAEILVESFLWQARSLIAVDLNEDGLLELVSTDGFGRVVSRINEGGRSFGDEVRINADTGARLLSLGDLDGDGDQDVIVGNIEASSLSLLENDGSGALVRRIGSYALTGRPRGVLSEDVNLDGIADIVVNRRDDGKIGVHFGLGGWTYETPEEFVGGDDVSLLMSGDFNEDQVPDLLSLDETLELGLTMLNVNRVVVANEPQALAAACREGGLEISVRTSGAWTLDARGDGRWRTLATRAGAVLGDLAGAGDHWILALDDAGLAAAGLDAATLELRLTLAGTGDETRLMVATCRSGPRRPAALAWAREPWPNPFNPLVHARIRVERAGRVTAGIYDLKGRLVARLQSGELPAGEHLLRWDGRGDGRAAAAGIYLLRVEGEQAVLTRKLMLIK